MVDFSQAVTPTVIITTIILIFVVIGIGIFAVEKFKKES
jgi:hypothetical protein